MPEWIEDLASALEDEPLSEQETTGLLNVAREVAHRVERKITPLSTFFVGAAVARKMEAGSSRTDALRDVTAALTGLLPEED